MLGPGGVTLYAVLRFSISGNIRFIILGTAGPRWVYQPLVFTCSVPEVPLPMYGTAIWGEYDWLREKNTEGCIRQFGGAS